MRTRILHVMGGLTAGGAERFLIDATVEMKKRGLPVEIVSLTNRIDGVGRRWQKLLEQTGVPLHTGPGPSIRSRTVLWLSQLLSQPHIRIVHLLLPYCERAYYFARLFHRRDYAVVRGIHSTGGSTRLKRWITRHSDISTYYSCGESVFRTAAELSGIERNVLLPNGLSFHWEPKFKKDRDVWLARLGLDASKTHFVHVGNHRGKSLQAAPKGIDVLIKAWRRFEIAERGGVLHMLGDGNLLRKHQRLAEYDPSILFHRVVSNVIEFLQACDTFCLPSRWEGLPIAGIEAGATGIFALLSNIGPNKDLGYPFSSFFEVDNVDELGCRLVQRIGKYDLADQQVVATFRQSWCISRPLDALLKLYRELSPIFDGSTPLSDGGSAYSEISTK